MKNNSVDNMQKTAVVLNKFLKAVNIFVFAVIAIMYVRFIFLGIRIYTGDIQPLADMISVNGIVLPEDTKQKLVKEMLPAFVVILIFIFIVCLCVFKIINTLRNILDSVAEARPFDGTVSASLSVLGKIILALGILSPLAEFCIEKAIWTIYRPVLESAIPGTDGFNILSPGVNIDLTLLFFGLFAVLMAYVFRYGEELQQLSDETL